MQQLMQEQKDIFGRFVHTSELATYTNLLLAIGYPNLGGKGTKIYFGIGGDNMCHYNKKKRWGVKQMTNSCVRGSFHYIILL
jgi:hypothetical protein